MPTLLSPVHVSSLHEPKTERNFPEPASCHNPLSPPAYLYATKRERAQAPLSVESLMAAQEAASQASTRRPIFHRYRCERRSCLENSETSRSSSVASERSAR